MDVRASSGKKCCEYEREYGGHGRVGGREEKGGNDVSIA